MNTFAVCMFMLEEERSTRSGRIILSKDEEREEMKSKIFVGKMKTLNLKSKIFVSVFVIEE